MLGNLYCRHTCFANQNNIQRAQQNTFVTCMLQLNITQLRGRRHCWHGESPTVGTVKWSSSICLLMDPVCPEMESEQDIIIKKKKNNNPNTQKKTMCKGWWYCNSAGHVPSARGLLICPRKVRFTIQNIQMGEYTWPKYGSCTTHSTQQLFGFFCFLGVNVERHGAFIKFIYQDQSRWTHSTTIQHPIRKPLGIRSTHGEKPQTIRKLFQQLCQKTAIFQNIYCHLHLDTQMWKMKNHVCKH